MGSPTMRSIFPLWVFSFVLVQHSLCQKTISSNEISGHSTTARNPRPVLNLNKLLHQQLYSEFLKEKVAAESVHDVAKTSSGLSSLTNPKAEIAPKRMLNSFGGRKHLGRSLPEGTVEKGVIGKSQWVGEVGKLLTTHESEGEKLANNLQLLDGEWEGDDFLSLVDWKNLGETSKAGGVSGEEQERP